MSLDHDPASGKRTRVHQGAGGGAVSGGRAKVEVRAQVRIARGEPARALVGEDGATRLAGLQIGVAQVEVGVRAGDARGEEPLVLGRRIGVLALRVEPVGAEECGLPGLRRESATGAQQHQQRHGGGRDAPEPARAFEGPDDLLGTVERAAHVAVTGRRRREASHLAGGEEVAQLVSDPSHQPDLPQARARRVRRDGAGRQIELGREILADRAAPPDRGRRPHRRATGRPAPRSARRAPHAPRA